MVVVLQIEQVWVVFVDAESFAILWGVCYVGWDGMEWDGEGVFLVLLKNKRQAKVR